MRTRGDIALAVALLCACGRAESESSAAPAPVASSAAGPASSSPPAAATTTAAAVATRWAGTYKSVPGTLYIPRQWKHVEWHTVDTPAGTGDGTLDLMVDPASGRVVGTLEGPLGPATLDGLVSEGTLTATIRRQDPGDRGFTGTLVGTVTDSHVDGTIHVTLAEASALRSATFEMSRAGSKP